MKATSIALALSVVASAAVAQGRPSTTSMSCRSATSLVAAQGAAVLGTGGDTFDRFVSDRSFCPRGQILKPGFAAAADTPQCMVGWRCFEPSAENR